MGFLALIAPITDAINSVVEGINKPITEREVIRQKAENTRVSTTQNGKTLRSILIAGMGVLAVYLITLIFIQRRNS